MLAVKKTIVWFLVLISTVSLLLKFGGKWTEGFFGVKQTSGISVSSIPSEATVFLDSNEVGKTPYEDKNLEAKDYLVRLEKEGSSWQGKVNLVAGTVTAINRDLAQDSSSSAGEILTLNKGKGVTVISNPSEAEVEIDGKSYGKTPLTINNIESGEHTILLAHPNYLKRSLRATLPDGFNLTVSVDLALSEADLTAITTPVIATTKELVVKDTPTGFLRVRDKPNLAGKEIAQVKPGDKLVLLEELAGWDRVKLLDSTEGYVSSSYVEKKNP